MANPCDYIRPRLSDSAACGLLFLMLLSMAVLIAMSVEYDAHAKYAGEFTRARCKVLDNRTLSDDICPMSSYRSCGCDTARLPYCEDAYDRQTYEGSCCNYNPCSLNKHHYYSTDRDYETRYVTRSNCTEVKLDVVIWPNTTKEVHASHRHHCTNGYTSPWTAASNYTRCVETLYSDVERCYYNLDNGKVIFENPFTSSKAALYISMICLSIAVLLASCWFCFDLPMMAKELQQFFCTCPTDTLSQATTPKGTTVVTAL